MRTANCSCPNCGQRIEFDLENVGRIAPCPTCGQELLLTLTQGNKSKLSGRPTRLAIIGIIGVVGLVLSLKVKEWAEFEAQEAAVFSTPSPYAPLYEMQAKAEVAAREVEYQKWLANLHSPVTEEPGKTKVFPPLTAAEMAKAQQIILGMDITRDEVENITWYEHPGKIGMDVSLYVGVFPSGNPVLRFKMRYHGDDWIFIKQFLVCADRELLTIKPKKELDRQNSDGHVWEIYDEPAVENIDTILKIVNSRKCIIRFEGEKYYFDYRVTDRGAESSMAQVLLVYRYLSGNFEK